MANAEIAIVMSSMLLMTITLAGCKPDSETCSEEVQRNHPTEVDHSLGGSNVT